MRFAKLLGVLIIISFIFPVFVNTQLNAAPNNPLNAPAVGGDTSSNVSTGLRGDVLKELSASGKESYATDGVEPESIIFSTLQKVVSTLLGLLGVVAVIMIIYAGFLWLTAGGSDEKVGKAKKIIKQAAIGIIIISLAYSIVAFVMGQLPQSTVDKNPKATTSTPQ